MKPFEIFLLVSLVIAVLAACAYGPEIAEMHDDVQAYQTKNLLPE
ncbi:MAG: hypothetical protein UY18_C0048G0001, partial [Microgenomates group bacterium GW2011_GWF2_47_9]